jgi:hypothetical protein
MLQTNAEELDVRLARTATPRFAHGFSQIPEYAKSPTIVHAKLRASTPEDIYEQEADRVSEQGMRMPQPQPQHACSCGGRCPKCQSARSGQEYVRSETKHGSTGNLEQVNRVQESHLVAQEGLHGPARPLPHFERIQSAFGPSHDLSKIRAHTDPAAKQATQKLSALAFTLGREIAFRGEPTVHLAAHEAAHVVQQRSGIQFAAGVESTGVWERHADAVADRVVQGRPVVDLLAPFATGVGAERVRVQFQKDPKVGEQSSSRRNPDLNELAKWPDDALRAWSTLDDVQRVSVTLAIAARYGAEFAGIFKAEASLRQHKESVNYYYGPGITWITPQKLLNRGFRLAQRDSVHEWWVHPKGDSVTRRWDVTAPQQDSKSSDGAPPTQGIKPTTPVPDEPEPPTPEECTDIKVLSDSICDNAERICKIAGELGPDDPARASCDKAQRSCKDAQERAKVCGPEEGAESSL